MKKPTNIKEFKTWLKDNHELNLTNVHSNYYDSTIEIAKVEFEKSEFWQKFLGSLQTLNQAYYSKTDYYLYKENYKPKVVTKSFDSVVSKCFRRNIVSNRGFPKEPRNGWLYPNECFESINDLIRTSVVVKYLDGIEFIINSLDSLAKETNSQFDIHYEARDTGYYAVHTYLRQEIEVPNREWNTTKYNFKIEIQITTELQENIKTLTHKYYEQRREKIHNKKELWQWKYESDEFAVNYLGHILHYLEGQIMDIRNKK